MFTVRFNASISRNHISLINTSTGEAIMRSALRPFSSEERMIADEKEAASFTGDLIRQIEGRRRWLRFFPTIDVTIVGEPREERDFKDVHRLFHEQGFVRIRVK